MGVFICNAVMACSLLSDFVVVSELQHAVSRSAIVTSDNPAKSVALYPLHELSNTREIKSEASYGE